MAAFGFRGFRGEIRQRQCLQDCLEPPRRSVGGLTVHVALEAGASGGRNSSVSVLPE